ncbi:uncharacterized protein si:ch211-108c6.2 [Gadus macrocephalus]|uniref:uncharacterized protein si:ch211-108c6.2 n=1 Tax=Gadus macrocephalus TaxID=80720 RepID=UPI0028CB37E0|nr:uncharacterized protein si:ch211-108c6.2 [Gadus macrocephalus]
MGQVQDKLEGVEGLEEALPGAEGLPTEAGGAVGGRGGTREKEVCSTRQYSGRASLRGSDQSSEEEPPAPSIEQNVHSRKHWVSPFSACKGREGGDNQERGGGEEGEVKKEGGSTFPSVTQESDCSQMPRSRARSEEQRPRKNRQFNQFYQTKSGGMNEEEPHTESQRKKMETSLLHDVNCDGETVEDHCVDGSSESKIRKGGFCKGTENVGHKAGKKRLLLLDPQGQNETPRGDEQHEEHGIKDNEQDFAPIDHEEGETYPGRASYSGASPALPRSEPSSILEKLLSRSRKEAAPGLSKIKEVDLLEENSVEALNQTNVSEAIKFNNAEHNVKIKDVVVQGEVEMRSSLDVQWDRTSPEDIEPGAPERSRPQVVAGDLVLKSPPFSELTSKSSEEQHGGHMVGTHKTHNTHTTGLDIGTGQYPYDNPTSDAINAHMSDKGGVRMRQKSENQQTPHDETKHAAMSARDGDDSAVESDRSQATPKSRPVSELIKETNQLHEKLHHDRPKSAETKPDVALEQAYSVKVAQMKAAFDIAQRSPDRGLERKPSVRKGKKDHYKTSCSKIHMIEFSCENKRAGDALFY